MQFSPHIAGLISIVIGLGSGAYLLWTLIRQHASKRWLTTKGEILESKLEEDSDGCVPHVRYSYTIASKYYTNDRLYFYQTNSSTARDALKHLSPYPVGKMVTVYYNPRKPEDAVLDRRVPLWLPLFWFFFAAFMWLAGMIMWLDGAF